MLYFQFISEDIDKYFNGFFFRRLEAIEHAWIALLRYNGTKLFSSYRPTSPQTGMYLCLWFQCEISNHLPRCALNDQVSIVINR